MTARTTEFGQPIGAPTDFTGARLPEPTTLTGRGIRLEPLARLHTADLFHTVCQPAAEELWTYRHDERPTTVAALAERIEEWVAGPGLTFALVSTETGQAVGVASLLRIDPEAGSIEVGSILYSKSLQRSFAATEAMSLLMAYVFSLGYRRYEWKCDSLNQPSRRAAVRLGFIWEGRFRNALVYKGRNRDTDWFSITDTEYPRVRKALDEWMHERNFDDHGRQRVRLLARPAAD